jgi:hypothetical protein
MTWLLSLITGPVLNAITGPFLEAYKAKLAAANSQDAKAVELAVKEIDAEIAARADATKILILENGRWWTWMPRNLVQWAASSFFCKCVVWDTMLGWGTTPPLRGDIAATYTAVMIMWFGGRTIEKVARIFKR